MIFIKRTFNFSNSREIRKIGQEAGIIDSDDAAVLYVEDYVGLNTPVKLPDETIETAISDALVNQTAAAPVFAYSLDAEHPDYDSKRDELIAKYEGTHPSIES